MNGRMDWVEDGQYRMYLFELERNSREQIALPSLIPVIKIKISHKGIIVAGTYYKFNYLFIIQQEVRAY